MSKIYKVFTVVLLLSVFTGIPLSSCAGEHDEEYVEDTLWEVYQSQPPLVNNDLILVEDKFRLRKPGNSNIYHLKPLHKLRARWGQTGNPNYHAVLHQTSIHPSLYCGLLVVNEPGNPSIKHGLSLSYVSADLVILEILHDECEHATYHESHGGLAHAERN